MFSPAAGRGKHCRQISLACGERSQCLGRAGFAPLTACVLSRSTPLRLQGALQGNCRRRALGCVHFPGLSCSGAGSRVLHTGANAVGPALCALPRPNSSGDQVSTLFRCGLITSPVPAISGEVPACLFWGTDLWLLPSRRMSSVQDPRKAWLATGSLRTVWWRMLSLGLSLPLSGSGCHPAPGGGWAGQLPPGSPLVFAQSFVLGPAVP